MDEIVDVLVISVMMFSLGLISGVVIFSLAGPSVYMQCTEEVRMVEVYHSSKYKSYCMSVKSDEGWKMSTCQQGA